MDQSRLKLIGGIIVASMTPLSAMLGTAAAATGRITTLAVVAALALGVVNLGNFLQGFFDTSSGRKQVAEEQAADAVSTALLPLLQPQETQPVAAPPVAPSPPVVPVQDLMQPPVAPSCPTAYVPRVDVTPPAGEAS